MVIVAIPVTSAINTGGTYFSHQETLFIDTSGFTDWFDKSAKLRVYTYYGDSTSNDNWNVENNKNDSDINNAACLANAIEPELINDNLYKFIITGDKVGAVKVMRVDSNVSTIWNTSGYMLATTRGSNDCIKITGWDSAEWTTRIVDPADPGQTVFDATPNSSITDNANLTTINATFFDYFTDEETEKGWRKNSYTTAHGDWEPYDTLNKKIVSASSGVKYPMYFGNFFNKEDGYRYTNFSNWVNNSSRLGGYNRAVINLAGSTPATFYEGVAMPYFDSAWLTSNKVGVTVNSQFPMRINEKNNDGIDYYTFDSTNALDNFWFSGYGNKTLTANYGSGTGSGAKDALYYYSEPKQASGYGFFPFDDSRGTNQEANDFGFGMRVDIPFNISYDGQIENKYGNLVDQVFEFSGDDDVWVYVDDHLVLDLGGDHKMATGNINFHHMKGYSTSGTNNIRNAAKEDIHVIDFSNTDWFSNKDPNKLHTLTMFYMERGMSESNLKFEYNFVPVKGKLIVTETINTTKVNDGLKDAVSKLDEFSFKPVEYTADGNKVNWGSKGLSYVIDGGKEVRGTGATGFNLKSGSRGEVRNFFLIGNDIDVEQIHGDSYLTYDTEYVYKNNTTGAEIDKTTDPLSGKDHTTEKGTLQDDTSQNPFAYAELQADFVNTPKISNVSITKSVTDFTGNQVPKDSEFDDAFNATIRIDLGDGLKTYEGLVTSQGTGSNVTLKNSETVTINGVPVGALIKVEETGVDGTKYAIERIVTPNGAEVVDGENNLQVVNPRVDPEGEIAPSISKYFFYNAYQPSGDAKTGIKLTANEFKFDLTTDAGRSNIKQSGDKAKGNNEDGDVFFDTITFAIDRDQADVPANTVLLTPRQAVDGVDITFNVQEQNVEEQGVDMVNDGKLTFTVHVKYNADANTLDAEIDGDSAFIIENELKSGSVTFSKKVLDEDGNEDPKNKDTFSATVTVSYNGGKTFLDVPYYYEDAKRETHQLAAGADGSFRWTDFGHGDRMTIYNLPYGTQVRIAEDAKTGYITPAPITLTVGDQGTGVIEMNPSATLINQVKPANSTVIAVNKSFTDAAKKANLTNLTTFDFTLEPQGNAPVPQNQQLTVTLPKGASTVSFDKIKFDPTAADYTGAGQTYTYLVKEVDGKFANAKYDTTVFTVTVNVKENAATGELDVTQTYKAGNASAENITFTNDYETGKISVLKSLIDFDGQEMTKYQNTAFNMSATVTYPNGAAETKTVTVKADGNKVTVVDGAPIGTTVSLFETDSKGLNSDADRENPKTAEITANDKDITITVTNVREVPEPVQTVVKANKIFKGDRLQDKEFTFTLTGDGNDNNNVSLKAKNDAEGNITFAPIQFSFGSSGGAIIPLNKDDFKNTNTKDYFFTLKEENPNRNDVDYDTTEYTVKITVTVNDTLSKLTVSAPEMVNTDENGKFTNYKRGNATVTKLVKQMVDGEEKDFSTDTRFNIAVTITKPGVAPVTENITLGANETKTYTNLPIGTKIAVNETDAKGFTVSYPTQEDEVKLNETDNTITDAAVVVKNMRPTPGKTEATPAVVKNLKGDEIADGQFRFNIKGEGFVNAGVNVENKGVNVTFPTITYQYTEGRETIDTDNHIVYVKNFENNTRVFTYTITEDSAYQHDGKMTYDGKTVTATVTVTKSGTDTVTLSNTVAYDNNATFENVKLSDVSISKKVQKTDDAGQVVDIKTTDDDYNKLAGQEFTVKVSVKYPGKDYQSLPLVTSKGQKMTEVADGVYGFTIKHNETVSISDLPVGTKVKFEEAEDSNYKTDSKEITVGKDARANEATLTNILQAPGKGYASVNKEFTPNAILAGLNQTTDNTYNFNLAYKGDIATFKYSENVSINGAENNWSANFPAITFPADLDYTGNGINFTFLMKETAATTTDGNIVVDTDTFTLVYNVKQGADGLVVTGPSIKKNGRTDAESATFYNGYRLGDVQVVKAFEDYDGTAIADSVVADMVFRVTLTATYANGDTQSFTDTIGLNKTAEVKDLPRGTKVTVTETDTKGMTLKGIVPAEVTIGESVQVVTVTNKRTTLTDTEVTIGARKVLEGSDITKNVPFNFTLTGEYKGQTINLTAQNDGNVVTFAPVKYTLDVSKKDAENTIYLAKTDFENDKVKMQFTVTEVKDDDRVNVKFDANLTRTVNVEITRSETGDEVALSAGVVDAMAPEFTNTKLGKVGFTKTVTDYDGQLSNPDIDFIFKAEKKVGNDWTSINDNIVINLSKGNDTFETGYLPVGTEVRFTETDNKGFISEQPKVVTVKDQDQTEFTTFSNIHPEAQGTEIAVTAKKTLVGATLKDNEFIFSLTGTVFGTEINQEKKNAADGSIKFDAIKFSLEKDEEGAIKLTKAMFANSKTLSFELTVTEIDPNRVDIQLPASVSQTVKGTVTLFDEGSDAHLTAALTENVSPEFTNIQLGRVGFNKIAKDINGAAFKPDADFIFKAEKKVGDAWTVINDNIVINLSKNVDSYVTEYLPVGTEVRFTETDKAGFENSVTEQTVTVALEDATKTVPYSTVSFTNNRPEPGTIKATLTAEKVLNGAQLSNGDFSFFISGEGAGANKEYKNVGKNITFDEITYKYSKNDSDKTSGSTVVLHDSDFTNGKAVREYTITEKNTALPDVIYATNTVKGVVTITKTETASTITLTADVTYPDGKTFTNTIKKGSVKVVKTNQAGEKVDDVTFKLFKVTGNDLDRDAVLNSTLVDKKTTEDGVAEFKNLDLYVDEYQNINNPTYQWYCLAETDPTKEYNLNSGLTFFQVPTADVYDLTYEYMNGKVITPTSGGTGMGMFTTVGCGLLGFGGLAFAGYMLFVRKSNKKRAHYRAK